jgi:hypothetical protein
MKLADYSQSVVSLRPLFGLGPPVRERRGQAVPKGGMASLDAALRAGGFEGVFHYLAGTSGYVRRIETATVVAGIRAKGWPQAGIDLPYSPANCNGAAAAARARDTYGFRPGTGFQIYLDIEPSRFQADPGGWPGAADRWCDQIRAAGFVPGVYGVDATLAACANHADRIWRAKPGMCDPAGAGLAAPFFAGRRAVQCGSGAWGGVTFDVSYSQFNIAAAPSGGGGGGDDLAITDPEIATGIAHMAVYTFLPGLADPSTMVADYAAALEGGRGLGDLVQELHNDSQHPDQQAYNAPALLAAIQALTQQVADLQAQLANLGPGGMVSDDHIAEVAGAAAVAEIEKRLENG